MVCSAAKKHKYCIYAGRHPTSAKVFPLLDFVGAHIYSYTVSHNNGNTLHNNGNTLNYATKRNFLEINLPEKRFRKTYDGPLELFTQSRAVRPNGLEWASADFTTQMYYKFSYPKLKASNVTIHIINQDSGCI